jgi:hypothetical protein
MKLSMTLGFVSGFFDCKNQPRRKETQMEKKFIKNISKIKHKRK